MDVSTAILGFTLTALLLTLTPAWTRRWYFARRLWKGA